MGGEERRNSGSSCTACTGSRQACVAARAGSSGRGARQQVRRAQGGSPILNKPNPRLMVLMLQRCVPSTADRQHSAHASAVAAASSTSALWAAGDMASLSAAKRTYCSSTPAGMGGSASCSASTSSAKQSANASA